MANRKRQSESQNDLLRAVLLSGDRAARAFARWQATADLNHAPPEQHDLFPLLYRNLEPLDIGHPWLPGSKASIAGHGMPTR